MDAQNAALWNKLAAAAKALEALNTEQSTPVPPVVAQRTEPRVSPVTLYLKQKTVLCVGGRTGKRCAFVENPSTSSLVRGLEQITDGDGSDRQSHVPNWPPAPVDCA